jgi:hypothetical protein
MKKSYIKYELFRMRRKFNPLTLFYGNSELTYTQFKEYFDKKSVESPDILYYNRVKQRFIEKQKEESNIIEISLEDTTSLEDVIIKKEKTTKKKNSSRKKIKK